MNLRRVTRPQLPLDIYSTPFNRDSDKMRPQEKLRGITLLLLALLSGQYGVQASRILFLGPVVGRSHSQFYAAIVTTLANRGHEMTFVSPYASKQETPRVREIVLPDLNFAPLMPNVFKEGSFAYRNLTYLTADLCAQGLQDPKVVKLFDETFDMIMTPTGWSECFLVFQHRLRVPFVLVNPVSVTPPLDDWFGNPSFPSYDVNLFTDADPPLSFKTRAFNIFMNTLFQVAHHWTWKIARHPSQSQGLLPDDLPSFDVIYRNASLLILDSYRAMEIPKAYVQNIVHAGGIHINPTNPLSQDLEEWVQGAGDHGFIYFSLGSVVKTSHMPEKHLQTLVRAFGRLPQRVLMKWNEDHIEGLAPNVRLSKWLPQQDLLAHPKARLFISHGGLHSIMESLYNGVPILGLPIFSDQMHNMAKGARQGWAIRLDWEELTEESLMSALAMALNETRLLESTRRMGAIIRDQPMTPAETVIYWIEYVLRHGGAHHLRCPAADMNWFILYNCDIWLAVVASICLVVYVNFAVLRCCLRCCRHAVTKKKTE
ncbi:UDP-glucosyltransferase 2-like [Oratosquilla oratoria]|uniref:UDP-glucosyltransferase 2-like n=1 Tax=Oratosquilla oratoria TaxID=337810 RepID=UPI003F76E1D6